MKMIEARVTLDVRTKLGTSPSGEPEYAIRQVGFITSMHETEEQALAWCRYLARLGNLIADRDVRGTLLAVEQEQGK